MWNRRTLVLALAAVVIAMVAGHALLAWLTEGPREATVKRLRERLAAYDSPDAASQQETGQASPTEVQDGQPAADVQAEWDALFARLGAPFYHEHDPEDRVVGDV